MAIAFVQATSATTTGASITGTFTTAPTNGNLIVAYVAQQSTNTWTAQSGWTQLTKPFSGDEGAIFYKYAGASETTAQTPCTTSTGTRRWVIHLAEYSGVDSAIAPTENAATDVNATKTSPTITPTSGKGALLIGGAFSTGQATTFSAEAVGGSSTGVTERGDLSGGSSANGTSAALWDMLISTTSGTYSTTVTASIAESGGIGIAIFYATASGGTGTVTGTHTWSGIAKGPGSPLATLVFVSDLHAGVNTSTRLSNGAALAQSLNADRIIVVGDLADNGLSAEYALLDSNWGDATYAPITKFVPGNHDYINSITAGYETWAGTRAFASPGYYGAEQIGGWHILYLNLCTPTDYDTSGDAMRVWLTNYLNANYGQPMIALWHHMPYSAGQFAPGHLFHATFGPGMSAIYAELQAAGCELIISGHDHSYQRFARMDNAGNADATGPRNIIVGTSNNNYFASNSPVSPTMPEVYNSDTAFLGVTKVSLYPTRYEWEFIPASGTTFTDAGSETTLNTANPQPTETTGLTDTYTVTVVKSLSNDDTTGLTDTSTVVKVLAVSGTDTTGLADTTALARTTAATDTTGLADTVAKSFVDVNTDAIGLTDAQVQAQGKTTTDTVGLTDTVTVDQVASGSIAATDTTGLADTTAFVFTDLNTDTAGVTDPVVLSFSDVNADNLGLTDTVVFAFGKSATDTTGTTDTANPQLTSVGAVSQTDTVALTDTQVAALFKALVETSGLTDTYQLTFTSASLRDYPHPGATFAGSTGGAHSGTPTGGATINNRQGGGRIK